MTVDRIVLRMLLWNHAGTDPIKAAEALIKLEFARGGVSKGARPFFHFGLVVSGVSSPGEAPRFRRGSSDG